MVRPNLSNHHMYFDSLFVGAVLPMSGFRDRAVFMGAAQLPSRILFHKFCNMDEQDDLSNEQDDLSRGSSLDDLSIPSDDDDSMGNEGAGAPVRTRRVLYYTLEDKKKIVEEAYPVPRNIRATARKWRVQPNQIRRWRVNARADAALPPYPYPRTIEERTTKNDHKRVKTRNEGRPLGTPEELLEELLPYVEAQRENGNAVNTTTVSAELLRRAPDLLSVGFAPLRRRVMRFLKKHHYAFCVVTHKAQNHRYHAMVIEDWVGYINRQIVASGYTAAQICNFDETNVDFDPTPRTTLNKVGERSISIRVNGHSGRCTVMLGCTAAGYKFPPFIIWKGVREGRIHRECQRNVFPAPSIYTVQPSGWMDGPAFQEWIERIVRPYAALHNGTVHMSLDQFSVHMQHDNTTALQHVGVEVDFIPAGYTSILQVMDKGLHKPFKQYLREESMAFMLNNPEGTKPTRLDIATWIQRSWDLVQPAAVLNSWSSIGIRPVHH